MLKSIMFFSMISKSNVEKHNVKPMCDQFEIYASRTRPAPDASRTRPGASRCAPDGIPDASRCVPDVSWMHPAASCELKR